MSRHHDFLCHQDAGIGRTVESKLCMALSCENRPRELECKVRERLTVALPIRGPDDVCELQ